MIMHMRILERNFKLQKQVPRCVRGEGAIGHGTYVRSTLLVALDYHDTLSKV